MAIYLYVLIKMNKSILHIVLLLVLSLITVKAQDTDSKLRSAREAVKQGNMNSAMSVANELLAQDSMSYEPRLLKGDILSAQQKYSDALKEYEKILPLRPEDAILLSRAGKAAYYSGDRNYALSLLNRATRRDPTRLDAFHTKIRVLVDLGRPQDALAVSDSTLWVGEDPESYFLQGIVNEKLDELQKSEWAYSRAIRIKPDYLDAYKAIIMLLINMGKPEDAMHYANNMIGARPNDKELLLYRSDVLSSINRTDEAISSISYMIDAFPTDKALKLTRGRYNIQAKKYDAALTDFYSVLPDNHAEISYLKGLAFLGKEMGDSARVNFEDVKFHVKPSTPDTVWLKEARKELYSLNRESDPPTLRFPDFESGNVSSIPAERETDTLSLRMAIVDRSEIKHIKINDSSVYFNPNRRVVDIILKIPVKKRNGVDINVSDVYDNSTLKHLDFIFPELPADSIPAAELPSDSIPVIKPPVTNVPITEIADSISRQPADTISERNNTNPVINDVVTENNEEPETIEQNTTTEQDTIEQDSPDENLDDSNQDELEQNFANLEIFYTFAPVNHNRTLIYDFCLGGGIGRHAGLKIP